ncbi:unnamed protein product [Gemmata massiliana]|uniref:Uncharacterized protein n=1 Tax=Gemmata massiliana TaxID=1210884 RepID=A0A6P2CZT3_9BACT|nr:unnamed protein product [Gemmata massiliana]
MEPSSGWRCPTPARSLYDELATGSRPVWVARSDPPAPGGARVGHVGGADGAHEPPGDRPVRAPTRAPVGPRARVPARSDTGRVHPVPVRPQQLEAALTRWIGACLAPGARGSGRQVPAREPGRCRVPPGDRVRPGQCWPRCEWTPTRNEVPCSSSTGGVGTVRPARCRVSHTSQRCFFYLFCTECPPFRCALTS